MREWSIVEGVVTVMAVVYIILTLLMTALYVLGYV